MHSPWDLYVRERCGVRIPFTGNNREDSVGASQQNERNLTVSVDELSKANIEAGRILRWMLVSHVQMSRSQGIISIIRLLYTFHTLFIFPESYGYIFWVSSATCQTSTHSVTNFVECELHLTHMTQPYSPSFRLGQAAYISLNVISAFQITSFHFSFRLC